MDEHCNEALFSLELVVEKVYLPHLTCRFPAVAFRLLDFPTILIKHVEDDLGAAIRQKVSFESSHHLPQQFHELKDRHGNFMVKKGKSCLFKMIPEVLKQHLGSTPLYVMIIDTFPNIPKLLGNSTVSLDSLISQVLMDIAKLGPTVPSVHGDKGLFKLYNLMGNEIGYLVLGLRLLCLGPSLIPHLPASAMAQMASHRNVDEDRKIEQTLARNEFGVQKIGGGEEHKAVEVRDSFSMTEPMRQDVLLQTVELEDKAVHVNVLENFDDKLCQTDTSPFTHAASTQTDRRKLMKDSLNANKRWVERNDMKIEDDGVIINNIICPPPLFYNSKGTPAVQIEHQDCSDDYDNHDMSFENLSDIDSFDGYGLGRKERIVEIEQGQNDKMEPKKHQNQKEVLESKFQNSYNAHIPQTRPGEKVHGLPVAPQTEAIFPLLSALINELSCIQDPQFLLNVSRKLQIVESKASKLDQRLRDKGKAEEDGNIDAPSVVAAVASALSKKLDSSQSNAKDVKKDEERHEKGAQCKEKMPKEKLTPKQRADNAKKKSKLVYGLTNTQRLRLQKVNPTWLKNVEKEVFNVKSKSVKRNEDDEWNATNFSDTLTEVRRLAEKELDSTAGGDTLRQIAGEVEEFELTIEKDKKQRSHPKANYPSPKRTQIIKPGISKKSPSASRQGNQISVDGKKRQPPSRSSVRSSPQRSAAIDTSQKSRQKVHHRRVPHRKEKEEHDESSDSDEVLSKKRPVPLERHMFGITSPSIDDQQKTTDYEDGLSARSDLPSSRSRSIEVRLPSVDPDNDDNATISDADDRVVDDSEVEDDIPLPDDSVKGEPKVMELNFPRYVSRDMSLPESIEGDPNASLNISVDVTHNSPLESTRQSKLMTGDQNESRVLHSTDYDTRQFHSTDEPELQGLMSDEDNQSGAVHSGAHSYTSVQTSQKFPVINPQLSENSPVPSVRRSTTKLDAGALSYLPSMSLSKGQMSPTSSRPGTPKGSSYRKASELEPIHKNARGILTPRSGSASPKRQTPRSRRQILDFKTSVHTDSVSSYMPSDPENVLVSLSSNSGNYSDDFQPLASGESGDGNSSVEVLPKLLPAKKLGYTIS